LGIIGMPPAPGPPGTAGGSPAAAAESGVILALGSDAPTLLICSGAAVVQLCGTESMPTEAALPAPAATCTLPMLGAPKSPAPEPNPLPTAYPSVWNWLPNTPAVGPNDCMNEPEDPIEKAPRVDIGAAEPVPIRLAADDNAREEDVHDDSDEDDIVDVAVARPGTMFPVAVVNGVDNIDVSWPGIIDVNWLESIELNWLDIIELSCPDITEPSWPDIREPSWLESIEPSWPGSNEASGLATTELSGVAAAELTV
jgi:hypothetical protein